ncbi:hypothetical protein EGI26_10580 [Lacihabitans sp. CCS-44]|nr:hypothetical protein [Lacihabitans sp. CCS-44]
MLLTFCIELQDGKTFRVYTVLLSSPFTTVKPYDLLAGKDPYMVLQYVPVFCVVGGIFGIFIEIGLEVEL